MNLLTQSARRMFPAGIALAILCGISASAQAETILQKLDGQNVSYEVGGDDYIYVDLELKNGRNQKVVISKTTQQVIGQNVRTMLSPVAQVRKDKIDAPMTLDSTALELLKNNNDMLMGSWEMSGDIRYFRVKIIDDISASSLKRLIVNLGAFADKKENEISGDRDDF